MENVEVEIKIPLPNAEEIMKRIEKLGGRKVEEGQEHDVYYDDGKGFFDRGNTLRLRTGLPKGTLLTYKESPMDGNKHIVTRTEIQTYVTDPIQMHLIFEKLGYKPYSEKDKKYTNYEYGGLVLEFHHLPFLGDFLEIEATHERIETVLPKFGLSIAMGTSKSYNKLFKEYKEENGLPKDVLDTFDDAKVYKK